MTTDERLDRLEQRVQELYAFKARVEARNAADDATVMMFLTEMEDRLEARLNDLQGKQQLMYELLLRQFPTANQQ